MSLFNFSPQKFYSRTPQSNQTTRTSNPTSDAVINGGNGIVVNNAGLPQTSYTIPGTTGYRLPAQSYINYSVNNPTSGGLQTLKTSLVKTAINSALQGLVYGLTGGPSTDPTGGRLRGTGVAIGGTSQDQLQASNSDSHTAFQDDSESRVIIYDQTGQLIGNNNAVLKPLEELNGVLFPYTPQIQVNHQASYDMMNLVHTNYTTPAYQYSKVETINITAQFTANYPAEAEYVIAMMHFFSSATKMFYGIDQLAGTPPPVLFLDGYGPYTFNHVPVVLTNFDFTLPNEIDYISCTVKGQRQKVPTSLQVSLSMVPTYSRNKISKQFGLVGFAKGALVGGNDKTGGWI
jgi:hypothetical protein